MNATRRGKSRRAGPATRRGRTLQRAALTFVTGAVMFTAACTSSTTGVTTQSPPNTDTTSAVVTTAASTPSSGSTTSTSPTASTDPSTTSPPRSPSSTPAISTTTSTSHATPGTSTAVSNAELQARADIEAAWTELFKTGTTLWKKPQSQWKGLLSAVAVDPVLTRALDSVAASKAKGKHDYGLPIHHPYWQVGVDGKHTATMGDCMDNSNTGSMDAKTGKKLTVGTPADNTTISAVKINGTWKIADFTFLTTVPCPAD